MSEWVRDKERQRERDRETERDKESEREIQREKGESAKLVNHKGSLVDQREVGDQIRLTAMGILSVCDALTWKGNSTNSAISFVNGRRVILVATESSRWSPPFAAHPENDFGDQNVFCHNYHKIEFRRRDKSFPGARLRSYDTCS